MGSSRQSTVLSTLRRGAAQVARLELLVVLALAPFLVFPQPGWTPLLMAIIPLLWLCRRLAHGRLTVSTPLDWPLLIMLAMTLISLWATFDLALSFPKLCGVLLGVATCYALANAVRTDRAVWLTVGILLAAGAAVGVASLVGTRWSAGKVPLLSPLLAPLYHRFPQLVQGIPRAEAGFNPNQVAGTVVLFIPLAVALLLHQLRRRGRTPRWALVTLGLAAVLALTLGVLLLTQSRQAYLSTALVLLLLAGYQGRWSRAVAFAALIAGTGLVAYYGLERTAQVIFGVRSLDALGGYSSWVGRLEIWGRALRVIRDHPITGIGFDTLFRVIHARYPTFLIRSGYDATHAHNVFLQVALDLGLPGLAAFGWLVVAFGRMLWQVWQGSQSPAVRSLALGLFSGMMAQFIFGLADAVALGQKPGIFLWAYFGLGAALWVNRAEQQEATARRSSPELVSRLASRLSRSWVRLTWLLVILSVVGWSYGLFARARTWLSVVESDLVAMQTLAREGPEAIAPWQPQQLLRTTRSDLLGFQAEFGVPLVLASHLGWLPGYGADLEAATVLLQIGLTLTAVGEDVLDPFQPLLGLSEEDPAPDDGGLEMTVAALQDAGPRLAEALAALENVQQARQTIRAEQLSPLTRGWVARLDQTLPLLESGVRGAIALPELLGASEPRTYLILVQNDDELRPTGGFISGVARVVLENGQVGELVFEDSYAVDDFSQPYPDPPAPLRKIMGTELWLFRDSNWSPDFPTSAQKALDLYRLRHDVDVDGVLALDQQALQLLVGSLGPLEITAYPEPVTRGNVIQAMRESWEPSGGEGPTQEWWRRRKEFMGRLLTAALRRLQDQTDANLMNLGWAAVQALEEKHLFVYLPQGEPAAELLDRTGWSGALMATPGDHLMVVDANLGFNKVNPYVRESLSYTVDLRDPSRPRATLRLVHRHTGRPATAPCVHEPRYDLTYEEMMLRCYWDYVRVYVPQGSRLLEATGHPVPGSMLLTGDEFTGEAEVLPDELGRAVFATFLVLAPGEGTETRFVYDLPSGVVRRDGDLWRYTLHIQKQGGTGANKVRIALVLPDDVELVSASLPLVAAEENTLSYESLLRTDIDLAVYLRIP